MSSMCFEIARSSPYVPLLFVPCIWRISLLLLMQCCFAMGRAVWIGSPL
jgi:hypothetical protein